MAIRSKAPSSRTCCRFSKFLSAGFAPQSLAALEPLLLSKSLLLSKTLLLSKSLGLISGDRVLRISGRGSVELMLYVSIFVELLRSRPSLAVWLAALAQALLWTLVPAVFDAAPPGDLRSVIAVGHEFQLGTYLGPPLAFWLAALAFDLAGRSVVGVYLLSHVSVVISY